MKITSVEKSKKNTDRMAVYIDGSYSFSISEEDYLTLNLYEEKEIYQEDLDYIRQTVNYRAAKATGVRYLALKLRSAHEVEKKLSDEGYDNETIQSVIDDLGSMGYINDRMYAQKYVFDRSKLKPKSKKMLKMELQARGISSDVIDDVLNEWDVDEESIAAGLARKKFGKYDLSDDKVIKKIYSFLQHRGFGYEQINKVIKNMRSD